MITASLAEPMLIKVQRLMLLFSIRLEHVLYILTQLQHFVQ